MAIDLKITVIDRVIHRRGIGIWFSPHSFARNVILALTVFSQIVVAACWGKATAGEYDFTIPEAQPKPWELGARLEARTIYHRFDEDSARYRQIQFQDDPGTDAFEWHLSGELSGRIRTGSLQAVLLTHHEYADTITEDEWINKLYEGYVSLTPTASLTLDAGKKRVQWGKGYAWNPVGFINPSKDPDDPSLNLEGSTYAGVDLIKSFTAGGLANMGLTAMLLPVIEDWTNVDFGEDGDLNAAFKLYLLWHDTDLDFIYYDGPSQPLSLGIDFSRNLAENIEVHGELAYQQDVSHVLIEADGTLTHSEDDQVSYLFGIRYLNTLETTFIAEYYHNGGGYDQDQMEDFFTYQEAAFEHWQTTGDGSLMQRAGRLAGPVYEQRNFGEDYAYLKISQKEPFDILYFNPWITSIVNLQDLSFNLQPGLTWTPVTNLEFNCRVGIPVGAAKTEFGEKLDVCRPEVWVRYYF
ncbi:hypothetical protein Dvar_12670 [Desulfosarcina variabilis str. Montpellier]|uniref:hypothetical protein n=1 Tax=Desulfosarcina variabilis TaxID=2300 RepID=UPI003AFA7115